MKSQTSALPIVREPTYCWYILDVSKRAVDSLSIRGEIFLRTAFGDLYQARTSK